MLLRAVLFLLTFFGLSFWLTGLLFLKLAQMLSSTLKNIEVPHEASDLTKFNTKIIRRPVRTFRHSVSFVLISDPFQVGLVFYLVAGSAGLEHFKDLFERDLANGDHFRPPGPIAPDHCRMVQAFA